MKIIQNAYWFVAVIAYACAISVLGACGASMPSNPIRGKAAGEWFTHMPSTPGPFGSMAYGRDGSSEAARVANRSARLDAYLKPEYRERAHALKSPRVTAPAPMLATKPVAPPRPALDEQVVAHAQPVSVAAPAAVSDTERYARREAVSKKQQDFKAGDVLVIGLGSLLVVVLIVVLLVLLLT